MGTNVIVYYASMTLFQLLVLERVREVPYGKVVSYGQIAVAIGSPQGARQVGWILRSMESEPDMPWWRVINNAGRITIKGNLLNDAERQRALLLSEGVAVAEDFTLPIETYRYIFK